MCGIHPLVVCLGLKAQVRMFSGKSRDEQMAMFLGLIEKGEELFEAHTSRAATTSVPRSEVDPAMLVRNYLARRQEATNSVALPVKRQTYVVPAHGGSVAAGRQTTSRKVDELREYFQGRSGSCFFAPDPARSSVGLAPRERDLPQSSCPPSPIRRVAESRDGDLSFAASDEAGFAHLIHQLK